MGGRKRLSSRPGSTCIYIYAEHFQSQYLCKRPVTFISVEYSFLMHHSVWNPQTQTTAFLVVRQHKDEGCRYQTKFHTIEAPAHQHNVQQYGLHPVVAHKAREALVIHQAGIDGEEHDKAAKSKKLC